MGLILLLFLLLLSWISLTNYFLTEHIMEHFFFFCRTAAALNSVWWTNIWPNEAARSSESFSAKQEHMADTQTRAQAHTRTEEYADDTQVNKSTDFLAVSVCYVWRHSSLSRPRIFSLEFCAHFLFLIVSLFFILCCYFLSVFFYSVLSSDCRTGTGIVTLGQLL